MSAFGATSLKGADRPLPRPGVVGAMQLAFCGALLAACAAPFCAVLMAALAGAGTPAGAAGLLGCPAGAARPG